MEWIIIVGALLYVICFVWNISTKDEDGRFLSAIILTILVMVLVALTSSHKSRNAPTVKDVYKGKTTLEITYRDSIPVDSIVVFKEQFKK